MAAQRPEHAHATDRPATATLPPRPAHTTTGWRQDRRPVVSKRPLHNLENYASVLDACTDCPAGKTSAAIGASSSGACASCEAGKYQDTVVITTNPPEASRTYSSICGAQTGPGGPHAKSMLDSTEAWAGGVNCAPTAGEWMQIDLGISFRVHGVVTQCRADSSQFVTEIQVQYSLTTSGFVSATALDGTTRFFLPISYSSTAKTMSNFSEPVTARYIRILVQTWVSYASMRAGVLTSLPGAAWNACADCPLNSQSVAGSTAPSSCLCNAGTRGV